MAGFRVARARFPACVARAASAAAALVLAAGSAQGAPNSLAPGEALALFDPTTPAALGSRGCAEIALASPGDRFALGAAPLACGSIAPPRPREFNFNRGEASWKLGLSGDARSIGQVRGAFDLDHALKLGPLGQWQLRGELALVRPSGEASLAPLFEQTRLTLSRGFAGWNLRFEGSAAAQGALDPRAAVERRTELSVNLTRRFRLTPFGTEHAVAVRLAQSSTLDLPSGAAEKLLLAGIDYSRALARGALTATLAWSRAAPQAGSGSARALLRYSLRF